MAAEPRHVVAIVGGATAGAEVAGALALRGVETIVFEQNPRPYGKIEDGLPRWHVALRQKEYRLIDQKLTRPRVHFVPLTRIGRDLDFDDLAGGWGVTAVILASGAWRDRPLPIPGADAYIGRGLVYQNPFIYWFNHFREKGYAGPVFETPDAAIVVGGGLASIDVVKVLQLETVRAALEARGIDVDMVHLEIHGIPDTLSAHGLAWEDLGLEGCTLFYRRRVEDMPLVEFPPGADAARREKVTVARRKLLEKAMRKYLFRVEPLLAPRGLIVENDRLAGLVFQRTRVEDGKLLEVPGETVEARGPVVISSIGSIPEPIAGVPMQGELIRFADRDLGVLDASGHVFGAGNVVTGKGNIVASRKHGVEVAAHVIESFLGLDGHAGEEKLLDAPRAAMRAEAEALAEEIVTRPKVAPEAIERILAKVRARQAQVGYEGDYAAWIKRVTPPDLA
jgi:NADPH-dependent glutamate synthase beta subunit-like oxidoreductase